MERSGERVLCKTGEMKSRWERSNWLLFQSPMFCVAVSVRGSVRLERYLHELAVVGLLCGEWVHCIVASRAVVGSFVAGRVSLKMSLFH